MAKAKYINKLLIAIFITLLILLVFLGTIFLLRTNVFPCRNTLGKPVFTGMISAGELGQGAFKGIDIAACVAGEAIENGRDALEIGFFKNGRMYKYKAFIGNKEEGKIGYCEVNPADGNEVCYIEKAENVKDRIIKGRVMEFTVVTKDDESIFWTENENTDEYRRFIETFIVALTSDEKFPEEKTLYISQIRL